MNKVSFFTPVNFRGHYPSFKNKLLEKVDHYFSLGNQKTASVVDGSFDGKRYQVLSSQTKTSTFLTALKIASYIIPIFPIIALVLKAILRSTTTFEYATAASSAAAPQPPKPPLTPPVGPIVGGHKDRNPPNDRPNIINRYYQIPASLGSLEGQQKLKTIDKAEKVKSTNTSNLGLNVEHILKPSEAYFYRIRMIQEGIGISDLDKDQDYYYDVSYYAPIQPTSWLLDKEDYDPKDPGHYHIIKRAYPNLPFDEAVSLPAEVIVGLKIKNENWIKQDDGSFVLEGLSPLPKYDDSFFVVQTKNFQNYVITRAHKA
jgi:Family of unknown function (DUF648)